VDFFALPIFLGGFAIVNAVAIALYEDFTCVNDCPDSSLKPINIVMAGLAIPALFLAISYMALAGIAMNCSKPKKVTNNQSIA
jgi:hypothetical protein